MTETIKVLDHGYVRFVEAWGHGDAGMPTSKDLFEGDDVDFECGIVEGARLSTQGSFRGWEDKKCDRCLGDKLIKQHWDPASDTWRGGRTCPTCEGKEYFPGDARLLKYLYTNKHSTPFEFSGMTIEVQAPIFVFREWHRHRTQSYSEMSARYAPLPDLNYLPTVERCFLTSTKNKQAGTIKDADELTDDGCKQWLDEQIILYNMQETHYRKGLQIGIPKELARIGLPVGRYSRMRASANLRNWLAFVTLRSDENAQHEIRMYSQALETIIADKFPRTYTLFSQRKQA